MSEQCKHCGRTIVLWGGDGKLWVHKDDGRAFCSMDDDDNNDRAKPSPEPEAAPDTSQNSPETWDRPDLDYPRAPGISADRDRESDAQSGNPWYPTDEPHLAVHSEAAPVSEAQAPAVPEWYWGSRCVECGKQIPAGQMHHCLHGGYCNHHVPVALRAEIASLREKLAQAERGLDLTTRLLRDDYPIRWQHAGGPNECKHGFAAGLPCRDCDLELLDDLITARRGKQR